MYFHHSVGKSKTTLTPTICIKKPMCTEEKQDNIHEAKHYIPPTVNQASLMMVVHYISFEQIAGKFLFSLKKKLLGRVVIVVIEVNIV